MARRKNVKRIDPRYFLNETVNRNDDGSRLEEDLDEGLYGDIDLAMPADERSAEELAADDLDASGEERLAFEKDPRAHSRAARTIDRSNYATNPPGKQDIYQFLKQDHPEVWAMWNQEEEIEEGFKDFVQGADDFMGDLMLGKPRGYSKDARQKRARMDADTAALDQRVADRAARKKEKTASDRASAQDRAKRRKAQDIRNRQLDKWEAGQKEKERAERDRKSRERDRDFDGPTRAYRTTYEE